ncbi:hypothetical protein A0H81_14105 [Grifola frondosa]|uniref:Fido domain-containing protein n=1 Tax=Grifola frondosa TaxID=5627 RepID=A0A1C7LM42_GRIFR|nr:hypothetical protein A0H81_14105 [Grifola frondosa]
MSLLSTDRSYPLISTSLAPQENSSESCYAFFVPVAMAVDISDSHLMASKRVTATFTEQVNAIVTGRSAVVVKPNELQSALARPANTAYYVPGTTVPQLAAELAYGIIQNHPFMDGNKRTAFWAANEYIREYGLKPFTDAQPGEVDTTAVMRTIGSAHEKVAQSTMSAQDLANVYMDALRRRKVSINLILTNYIFN